MFSLSRSLLCRLNVVCLFLFFLLSCFRTHVCLLSPFSILCNHQIWLIFVKWKKDVVEMECGKMIMKWRIKCDVDKLYSKNFFTGNYLVCWIYAFFLGWCSILCILWHDLIFIWVCVFLLVGWFLSFQMATIYHVFWLLGISLICIKSGANLNISRWPLLIKLMAKRQ